jgi:DNA-binding beta-propeller fold protein YncE
MRVFLVLSLVALLSGFAIAQEASSDGPYKVIKTAKVGGDGGFDYVYADSEGRRLYIPRTGPTPRVSIFDLDTLSAVGELSGVSAHGVVVDPKSHHGFATSSPVTMWDSTTLKPIKTIDVQGHPDGILFDSFNQRVYILSHAEPNMTVINSKDGSVVGTINIDGAPEQAATDGKGHIYVDVEDKGNIAVVDAKTMQVTAHYDLAGNKAPAGLAFDAKHHVLFVECREPAVSVVMDAKDGQLITTLPIGTGVDGAGFMPQTLEAFSSQGDGSLTVVKERTPKTFEVEETLKTMPSAKTMTIDAKTHHIFLIAAEFGPPPPPDPENPGRRRRGALVPGSFTILEAGK